MLAFVGEGDRRSTRRATTIATLHAGGGADRVARRARGSTAASRTARCAAAVVVPLTLQNRRVGSLCAFYTSPGRIRPEDMRVVQEAASLVGAQVALAALETQGELLARAELRALRAQISPHFVYNALTAVANSIHTSPDEARELLTEFSEFIRYAFARERPYVTLADELRYVEKYLRLEQARFGDRLRGAGAGRAGGAAHASCPALSVQPLVENAIRHGLEMGIGGRVQIIAADFDREVELRVVDDGAGMPPGAGRGGARRHRRTGIGLANVDRRLRTTFGEEYGLEIESQPAARHLRGDDAAQGPGGGEGGMSEGLCLLAVDDELPALHDLARMLRASPAVAHVDASASGEDALGKLARRRYDGVFLDVRMPGVDGLELAGVVRRFGDPPAVVFVSAYENAAVEAFELHVLDYLVKPVSRQRIDEAIRRVAAEAGRRDRPSRGRRERDRRRRRPRAGLEPARRRHAAPARARRSSTSRRRATSCASSATTAAATSCAAAWATSRRAGARTGSCASTAATSSTCAARSRCARS